jgi:large subunit ribosomal protein L10
MSPVAEIKDWKKEEVQTFADHIDESSVVGVVNLQNLPAPQLQQMRAQLRDTVTMKMTKITLMKLAFKKCDKDVSKLEPYLNGMPALLFSEENPFKLYSILKQEKSKAPIKGGQEAPHDIVVPAGPTDFPPGPIIGQLGSLGIPTGVDAGKVAVEEDTVVAEAGETVSQELAGILTRLGIKPMEVGLDLRVVYQDGDILTKDVLDVDEDQYLRDIQTAASWAFNLAVNASYPTSDTIRHLITKSHSDALALAHNEDIITPATIEAILAKVEAQATSLDDSLNLEEVMDKLDQSNTTEEATTDDEPSDNEDQQDSQEVE